MKPKSPLCFSHHIFRAPLPVISSSSSCSIFHPPSSALDLQTTSSQFITTKRLSAIHSYCLQLQTLTSLIAVSPVWRTSACSSRGAPQSPAAATPLSPSIIHRETLRTKVADVLE